MQNLASHIELHIMLKKTFIFSVLLSAISFSDITLAAQAKKPAMPPAVVEAAIVQPTSDQQKIVATGTVTAVPGIVVRAEASGRITNIFFKPGDDVVAGAPLVEINPDPLKADLEQAQANEKLAQLNFDRYAKLYATHVVSKADYDQYSANLTSAKANVDLAKANLRETAIVAAFSGRLGLNLVNLGDYVSVGQDIVNLQSLTPIYVDFAMPEVYTSKIAAGQKVYAHSDAYPNETFEGEVSAYDPLVNATNRSINVRALIPNKEKKLLPGGFVEVTALVGSPQKVISIPQTAVVYAPEGNYVYKVVKDHAVKVPVTLGKRDQQNIIIEQGLVGGEQIVTSGQLKIAGDGSQVVVITPKMAKEIAAKMNGQNPPTPVAK